MNRTDVDAIFELIDATVEIAAYLADEARRRQVIAARKRLSLATTRALREIGVWVPR